MRSPHAVREAEEFATRGSGRASFSLTHSRTHMEHRHIEAPRPLSHAPEKRIGRRTANILQCTYGNWEFRGKKVHTKCLLSISHKIHKIQHQKEFIYLIYYENEIFFISYQDNEQSGARKSILMSIKIVCLKHTKSNADIILHSNQQ